VKMKRHIECSLVNISTVYIQYCQIGSSLDVVYVTALEIKALWLFIKLGMENLHDQTLSVSPL